MNVLGLCSGIGGLELGVHLAEPAARPVCFVEREPFCQSILQQQFPDVPIWDDVTTFDASAWRGSVDVVAAGFPCQPVSVAGKRLGADDPRWLWPHVARVVRDAGPRFVFLENVPGLIAKGVDEVLLSLASLGFDAEWGVFSCASVGASHRRERWFCLGHADSVDGRRHLREWSTQTQGSSLDLADTQGAGPSPCGAQGGGAQRQPRPSVCSRDLADADSARLEIRQEQHHCECEAAQRSGRALWAPGSDAEWGDIDAALWPSEQPLCGVANGFPRGLEPQRKQRLMALGNAVSPPVAAVAWRVLMQRHLNHQKARQQ